MVEKKSTKAKSTPKKRAVKKVEVSQPVSEPRQAEPVQPQINWDVIGFSSAAVTLTGAGLLFMIGWSYEASWYGYFGVSINQVNVQPQQILIQSVPAIVTTITFLFFSLVAYVFLMTDLKKTESKGPIVINKLQSLTSTDWKWILILSLIILYGYLVQRYYGSLSQFYKADFSEVYEILYAYYLALPVITVGIFIIFFLAIICTAYVVNILRKKKSFFQYTTSRTLSNETIGFMILLLIFSALGHSAEIGIYDAAHGRRGSGGWRIQPFFLSSDKLSGLAEDIKASCSNSTCLYGPFGLIGENSNSYILIKWKDKNEDFFSRNPGLYIIPKGDNTYLIPFIEQTDVTLPPPTFIPAITPTITPTSNLGAALTPTVIPRQP